MSVMASCAAPCSDYVTRGVGCNETLLQAYPLYVGVLQWTSVAFFSMVACFAVAVLLVRFRTPLASTLCACTAFGRRAAVEAREEQLRRRREGKRYVQVFNNKDRATVSNAIACIMWTIYQLNPEGMNPNFPIPKTVQRLVFKRVPESLWLACCVLLVATWAQLAYTIEPNPAAEARFNVFALLVAGALPAAVLLQAMARLSYDLQEQIMGILMSTALLVMVVPGVYFACRLRRQMHRHGRGVQGAKRSRLLRALHHVGSTLMGGVGIVAAYTVLAMIEMLGKVYFCNKPTMFLSLWLSNNVLAFFIASLIVYAAKQPLRTHLPMWRALCCCCGVDDELDSRYRALRDASTAFQDASIHQTSTLGAISEEQSGDIRAEQSSHTEDLRVESSDRMLRLSVESFDVESRRSNSSSLLGRPT